MPTYDLTSSKTGRTYQVDFASDPTPEDVDYAINFFDAEEPAAPAAEQPGFGTQLYESFAGGGGLALGGGRTSLGVLTGDVLGMAAGLTQMQQAQARLQASQTPEDVAFAQDIAQQAQEMEQAEGILPTLREAVDLPLAAIRRPGAALRTAVQSLPNVAITTPVTLAGGLAGAALGTAGSPVGSIVGAVATGGAANAAIEVGYALNDLLNERTGGASATMTEEQIAAYLEANPDIVDEAQRIGLTRGATIGAVEALGLKGAGRLTAAPARAAEQAARTALAREGVDLASRTAVREAMATPALREAAETAAKAATDQFNLPARALGAVGIEAGAAAGGELAAQAAAGQELDFGEAFLETLGEGLGAPASVLGARQVELLPGGVLQQARAQIAQEAVASAAEALGDEFPDLEELTRSAGPEAATEVAAAVTQAGAVADPVVPEPVAPAQPAPVALAQPTAPADVFAAAEQATMDWDRANRGNRSDEWFAQGKALQNRAFTEAGENAGADQLQAHGVAKVGTLTEGLRSVIGLLQNGIDPNRGGGRLDTAQLALAQGQVGSVGATASGTAYRDGPFILVQSREASQRGIGIRSPNEIAAVLVNDANLGQLDAIRAAIQAVNPNVIVAPYSEVANVSRQILNAPAQQSLPAVEAQAEATGQQPAIQTSDETEIPEASGLPPVQSQPPVAEAAVNLEEGAALGGGQGEEGEVTVPPVQPATAAAPAQPISPLGEVPTESLPADTQPTSGDVGAPAVNELNKAPSEISDLNRKRRELSDLQNQLPQKLLKDFTDEDKKLLRRYNGVLEYLMEKEESLKKEYPVYPDFSKLAEAGDEIEFIFAYGTRRNRVTDVTKNDSGEWEVVLETLEEDPLPGAKRWSFKKLPLHGPFSIRNISPVNQRQKPEYFGVSYLDALRAVATNTATPEQIDTLTQQGLVRVVQGQPVITDAGLAMLPEGERPRLTEAERVAEIEGQTRQSVNVPVPPREPTRPLTGDAQRNETLARRRRGKPTVPTGLRTIDGAPLSSITVTTSQATQARTLEAQQTPGAQDTWIGTAEEYLAENPDAAFVADNPTLEAFYDPAVDRAVILTDRVQVREGDAVRAARNGTSAGLEAVRRLIRHESFVHRGWRALPKNLKDEFLSISENVVPADDLDQLAKIYKRFANWRNDSSIRALAVEEWLAQRLERIEKLPAGSDSVLNQLVDWAKRVWQWLAGDDSVEPTRAELVELMRQMVRALETGEKEVVAVEAPTAEAPADIRFSLTGNEAEIERIIREDRDDAESGVVPTRARPLAPGASPTSATEQINGQEIIERNQIQKTSLQKTRERAIEIVDALGPMDTWLSNLLNPAWQEQRGFNIRSPLGQYVIAEALNRVSNVSKKDRLRYGTLNDLLARQWQTGATESATALAARSGITSDPRYAALFAVQAMIDEQRKQQAGIIDPALGSTEATVEATRNADDQAQQQATEDVDSELRLKDALYELGLAGQNPDTQQRIRRVNDNVFRLGVLARLREQMRARAEQASFVSLSASAVEAEYAAMSVEQLDAEVARLERELQDDLAALETERRKVRATKPTGTAKTVVDQAKDLIEKLEAAPGVKKTPKPNPVRDLYKAHLKQPMAEGDFVRAMVGAGVPEADAQKLYELAAVKIAAAEATKVAGRTARLMDRETSSLENLINKLRPKITGGLNWREIFDRPLSNQREWRQQLFDTLRADPALANLSPAEVRDLAAEIDRIWNAKREAAFKALAKRMNLPGAREGVKEKIAESAPALIRYINSGAFNDVNFRNAIADKFGVPQLDEARVDEVIALVQKAQEAETQVERNKFMVQAIRLMQEGMKAELGEVISNYWVTSVLSGFATLFDMAMSVLNGARVMTQFSADAIIRQRDFKLAGRAAKNYFQSLGNAILESTYYFVSGDPSMLDNYQFTLNTYLREGSAAANPFDYFERIIKDPSKPSWAKIVPYYFAGLQRLMTAFDHINSTSTAQGTLEHALAYNRKLFGDARMPSQQDVAAARAKAVQLAGGDRTFAQKRKVTAYTRQILNEEFNKTYPGILDEAKDIGRIAAYQNDPTGIGGIIYHTLLGLTNKAVKAAGDFRDEGRALGEAQGIVSKFMREFMYILAVNSRNISGTRFVRFVGNRVNELISFTPGAGYLRTYEKDTSPTRRAMLLQNQVVGILLGTWVVATLLRMMDDEEDDEKRGFRISGSWQGLTPDRKNQLRANNMTPNSVQIWDGEKWVNFNYTPWPVASLLATVGNLADMKKYHPERWGAKEPLDRILAAAWAGAFSFKDLSAISGFMDMFGASAYSGDPVDSAVKWLGKFSSNYVGGVVPRMLKDIDMIMDPKARKPTDISEHFAKELPFYRRTEAGGERMYNIFGEQVELNRLPWRRVVTATRPEREYQILAELNNRGLFLGVANADNRTVGMGASRRELTDEEAERYAVETGKRYRQFVLDQGERLLEMDENRAKDFIARRTEALRNAALRDAIR